MQFLSHDPEQETFPDNFCYFKTNLFKNLLRKKIIALEKIEMRLEMVNGLWFNS